MYGPKNKKYPPGVRPENCRQILQVYGPPGVRPDKKALNFKIQMYGPKIKNIYRVYGPKNSRKIIQVPPPKLDFPPNLAYNIEQFFEIVGC